MAAWLRYIGIIVALLPGGVLAQTSDTTAARQATLDTTVTLPNVTVEALRDRLRAEAAPLRITTLRTSDIAATGAATAAELLQARTGLFIKQYGAGGLALPSLRGTSGSQTLVLVDGQRVADPQSGQVDLSLLPTVLLDRVDVMHGAASARYGSGSMGGVVRLHTLAPTQALRVKTSGVAGAFGRRTAGGVVSGGTRSIRGLAAVEVGRAERDFPYVNETLRPPRTVRRDDADRTLTTLFGKLNVDPPGHQLSVTAWYNDVERGLPGASNAPSSGARQWDTHGRLLTQYRTQTPLGALDVRGRAQHTHLRYVNPATATQRDTRTQAYDLTAALRQPISTRGMLGGGVTTGLDHADARGGVRRIRWSAFAHAAGTLGSVTLYPALRLDYYLPQQAPNVVALSPQLGLNWAVASAPGVHLKASVGRAFRAPTFGERFFDPGGTPSLRAEHGWSTDAGVVVRHRGARTAWQVEATAFATRIRDQIVWFPSVVGPGVRVWRPSNVAQVLSRGVEASVHAAFRPPNDWQLRGGLSFTHTAAENRANPALRAYGHQLRYIPREQLKWHAGVTWQNLGVDLSGRLVSRRFITADETQALPPYQVIDARLHYERALGPVRLGLGLTIDNVFNHRYSIIRFYPMPPRHARLRLTLETIP